MRAFRPSFKAGGGLDPINRPATGPKRNFCPFVAKKSAAFPPHGTHFRQVITGKDLTAGCVEQTKPLPSDGEIMRNARRNAALPVRIVAKLCGAIESQVPVGYEDEGGFHYGADFAGEFYSI